MYGGNNKPGGFNFGATPPAAGSAPATAPSAGFSFGAAPPTGFGIPPGTAQGFQLGGTTATPPSGNPGFSFNNAVTSTPATQAAKPGITPTVTPGGGFSFGAGLPAPSTNPGLGATTTQFGGGALGGLGGALGATLGGGSTGGAMLGGVNMGGASLGGANMGGTILGTTLGGVNMGGATLGTTLGGANMGGAILGTTLGGANMGGATLGTTLVGANMGGATVGTTLGGTNMGGTTLGGTSLGGANLGGAMLGGGSIGGTTLGGAKPTGTASPGFSFGIQTPAAATGLNLGATTTAATPAAAAPGGFSFGQIPAATGVAGNLKPAATTSAVAPSLGFPQGGAAPSATGASGLSLGVATANTAKPTTTGLPLGTAATPNAATGFGLPTLATASTVPASGFGLNAAVAKTTPLTSLTSAVSGNTTIVTAGPPKQMTYHQLEEAINKWTTELTDQESIFLQQATQVNAWDRLVMENGEKIINLSQDVDRVKTDQQKLDHEIDFIHAQQRELEELLQPLEKSLEQMPPISFQQHADLQREHTYQLAESIDAQMKRMGQDLKETIERLNATNSKTDPHDPVQQITKILNAHMDSLLWIDRNSASLYRRVEDISKEMDTQRREQERNYRLVYN